MNYYTGIGSRKTPKEILDLMHKIAVYFNSRGDYILRSGGAKGADQAFESGTDKKEIYYANDVKGDERALTLARDSHPAWNRCSPYARLLHARNVYQVLGKTFDQPSNFVVCWTPDGCISDSTRSSKTGGTGTAISIADRNGIPVYNLNRKDHLNEFVILTSQWSQLT